MKIVGIGSAFPISEFDASEIGKWTGAQESYIAERVGIAKRRFLLPHETGLQLAAQACVSLSQICSEYRQDDIDLLIYVTQTPDQKLPQMSSQLQNELQMKNVNTCTLICPIKEIFIERQ